MGVSKTTGMFVLKCTGIEESRLSFMYVLVHCCHAL